MHAPQLDFEHAPDRWQALVRWVIGTGPWHHRIAAGLALLCALGLLGLCAWRAVAASHTAQVAALARSTQQTVRQAAALAAAHHSAKAPTPAEAAGWNQVLRALNTPWSALFDALERHTPAGVALLSVQPDPREGRVRLQAEARTLDDAIAYAAALRQDAGFEAVTLLRHETHERDSQRPIRLTFDLQLTGGQPPQAR
jgi:Tfp pilus assembly protein PilN